MMKWIRYPMLAALFMAALLSADAQPADIRWMKPGAPTYNTIAFSPDGNTVAALYVNGVLFTDAVTSEVQGTFNEAVFSVAYSRDGKTVACGGTQGRVWLIDAKSLRVVDSFAHQREGWVLWLEFISGDRELAMVMDDLPLSIWNLDTGTERHEFPGPGGVTQEVRVSPDSRRVATRNGEKLYLFDLQSGVFLRQMIIPGIYNFRFGDDGESIMAAVRRDEVHRNDVHSLIVRPLDSAIAERSILLPVRGSVAGSPLIPRITFTPDSGHVAVMPGNDSSVLFINMTTGELVRGLYFAAPIYSALFSADGRFLAVAGRNMHVHQLDARSWNYIRDLPLGQPVEAAYLAQSPDGSLVATASGVHDTRIRIWDTRTGILVRTLLRTSSHPVRPLFAADGRHLLLTTRCPGNGLTGELWDIAAGEVVRSFSCLPSITWGSLEGLDSAGNYLFTRTTREWQKFDLETGERLIAADGRGGTILAMAISRDGSRIATITQDDRLRIWSGSDGGLIRELPAGEQRHPLGLYTSLAFSPDGDQIIAGGLDSAVHIIGIFDGERRRLRGHDALVHAVALSSDGKWIASAGFDQTIRFWRFSTGEEVHAYTYPAFYPKSVPGWMDVTITPDFSSVTGLSYTGWVINYSTDPVLRAAVVADLPAEQSGMQALPNPAIGATTITFELPKALQGTVKVFNLLGEEVALLAEGMLPAGMQSCRWDATMAPPGLYLVRLDAGEIRKNMRLVKE